MLTSTSENVENSYMESVREMLLCSVCVCVCVCVARERERERGNSFGTKGERVSISSLDSEIEKSCSFCITESTKDNFSMIR